MRDKYVEEIIISAQRHVSNKNHQNIHFWLKIFTKELHLVKYTYYTCAGCHSDGKDVEWQVPVMLVEKTLDSGVWCMPPALLWSGTR